MPTSNPEPIERIGLTDEERFDSYVKGSIYTALRQCEKAGWVRTDPERSEVGQYHDLHSAAAAVLRQLKSEGLRVTTSDEGESLLWGHGSE
jgi:DNA-binding PadR family transcriptional regulator